MLEVLGDAVNNPDIAEPFTILRNPGSFVAGGWVAGTQEEISAYGTVGLASNRDILAIPEADRVREVRVFHSSTPMYVTSADLGITADILEWRGVKYRVASQADRSQRGYYGMIAVRMDGA